MLHVAMCRLPLPFPPSLWRTALCCEQSHQGFQPLYSEQSHMWGGERRQCASIHCPSLSSAQVKVPGLPSRYMHSATALSLSPGLTEVTQFGGSPEWPKNYRNDADFIHVSNTAVLRLGESPACSTIRYTQGGSYWSSLGGTNRAPEQLHSNLKSGGGRLLEETPCII